MTAEWISFSAVGICMIAAKSARIGQGGSGGCQAVMAMGRPHPAGLKPKNLIGGGWVLPRPLVLLLLLAGEKVLPI